MSEQEKQPKVAKVNASTLVDLKAELIRKQQELRQQRLQRKAGQPITRQLDNKKTSVWNKKNVGVLERNQKDLEVKRQEDNDLNKARSSLEAKAKLYEQMTSGKFIPDEDVAGERFLVDFEQKAVDKVMKQREERWKLEEQKRKEEEFEKKEQKMLKEEIPSPENPDEEWVDYVDSLGRSRRCMKKDLTKIKQNDPHLKQEQSAPESVSGNLLDLMSADMHREMLREKWEKEEKEMSVTPDGPVHYANVQWDEIREHGVAYYQFDKSEGGRQQQMETLKKLRQQTKEQRGMKERVKEKRKAIMAARLAKVKQRRMVHSVPEDENSEEEEIHKEAEEVEELVRDDTLRQNAPMRDWDKGKPVVSDWVKERREERLEEFAPPSIYKEETNRGRSQVKRQDQVAAPSPKLTKSKKEDEEVGDKVSAGLKALREMSHPVENQGTKEQTEQKEDISHISQIPIPNPSENPLPPQTSTENIRDISLNPPLPPPVGNGQPYSFYPPPPPGVSDQYINYWQGYNGNYSEVPNVAYGQYQPHYAYSGASNTDMQGWNYSTSAQSNYLQQSVSTMPPPPPPPAAPAPAPAPSDPDISTSSASYSQSPVLQETAEQEQNSTNLESDAKSVPEYNNTTTAPASDPVSQESGPQPAHYSSGPVKCSRPTGPKYQRVHLHQLPASLPAPPTTNNIPQYPSMDEVHGTTLKTPNTAPSQHNKHKDHSLRNWYRQYDYKGPNKKEDKLPNIPFPSPYIQKKDNSPELFPCVEFDPSRPPPTSKK